MAGSYPLDLDELESAWAHVEDNAGMAGADCVTVARFAHECPRALADLLAEVQAGSYRPVPLLRIDVQKKAGADDTRTLLLPAVRDRVVQTAVVRKLTPGAEQEESDASFAYRPGRGVNAAVARAIQLRDRGLRWGVQADIESFFDQVEHARLLEALARLEAARPWMELLGAWLHTPVWDGAGLKPFRRGVPQGAPISPLLANLYLQPLDDALSRAPFHLVRYADDLLILCPGESEARQALDAAEAALGGLRLALNREKSGFVTFDAGFHYLGVFFLGEGVFTPWGHAPHAARAVSIAAPMPARALARYLGRNVRGGRPRKTPTRHGHAAAGTDHPEVDMAFLYLAEEGTVVRKSGDRILADLDGQIRLDLPVHKVEHILLFGNIQVTGAAVCELLQNRIDLSFLTRHGHYLGSLVAPSSRDVFLRASQYDAARDAAASFGVARAIVEAKIGNGQETLRRLKHAHGGDCDAAESELTRALAALQSVTLVQALDGVEGSAARAYFAALMSFNLSAFEWPGRLKHPAPDPINALLSLTYTLLTNELHALLAAAGLDPYFGFLHQLDYGRPSLALDLVEAFRHPLADRFVLASINQNLFQPDDFYRDLEHGGLCLKPEPLRRYFDAFEKTMLEMGRDGARPPWRSVLRAEVELLARHFRHGEAWTPFRYAQEDEAPAPSAPMPKETPASSETPPCNT